jgi:hypothetical protein
VVVDRLHCAEPSQPRIVTFWIDFATACPATRSCDRRDASCPASPRRRGWPMSSAVAVELCQWGGSYWLFSLRREAACAAALVANQPTRAQSLTIRRLLVRASSRSIAKATSGSTCTMTRRARRCSRPSILDTTTARCGRRYRARELRTGDHPRRAQDKGGKPAARRSRVPCADG